MDMFEYMKAFPCIKCGHILEKRDAEMMNDTDKHIQDQIEKVQDLLPVRQRAVIRAILGHLEVCQ